MRRWREDRFREWKSRNTSRCGRGWSGSREVQGELRPSPGLRPRGVGGWGGAGSRHPISTPIPALCVTLDFTCRNLSFVINNRRQFRPPCTLSSKLLIKTRNASGIMWALKKCSCHLPGCQRMASLTCRWRVGTQGGGSSLCGSWEMGYSIFL